MTALPPPTKYHRWLGWHSPAMRRAVLVGCIGLAVGLALAPLASGGLALLGGWDAAAFAFLLSLWPMIVRADPSQTDQLSTREDEGTPTATLLVLGASVASLLGVGLALSLAGQRTGGGRVGLIAVALVTVVLSWNVVNTVFCLRYAHRYYADGPPGIDFGTWPAAGAPAFRDFAYLSFTIGMTYQVSDTVVRDPRIRHIVLVHALLSYVFGVVIVAGAINLIAGLIR